MGSSTSPVSEFLSEEEVAELTGREYPSKQIEWLNRSGWKYAVTAANRPIVGRVYARLKLAGVKPTMEATEKWSLDLSRVR
ncbi:TPA: DUF4224 domain-containing protein [Pseudomonas aeruginosa]|uniref:DUF4224 domain-containing protein n=1 Tax=Pseudomonas aeruginosa TaxID=287 RepID=UPI00093724B2|nr:DUF4224 domain-containing protein [Pseudomonas aeruginosa]MBX6570930.1 DUF4224 domain-containing protein [Pseudomonas aeruginosa]MBX6896468.1 DUF4224 domain-containing protein [Pseudomonas aeruginosa]MBX6921887.1 DUF4224 domain-containing protein [Pseudomonas aeruginosa]MBY5292159.1 DUF4224 domain-containing protein [Pseudomonas aeruginosa]MCV6243903.1 DUF4224 domain-containing protein [Pseudomonas aeruginosa]